MVSELPAQISSSSMGSRVLSTRSITPPVFGFQWHRYQTTQLDNDEVREADRNFRIKTGLRPEEGCKANFVLDVGCGMGCRFAEVATRWGARVVGIDLSAAAEVAAKNLPDREFVARFRRTFSALPFAAESFDVISQRGGAAPHAGLRGGGEGARQVSEAR